MSLTELKMAAVSMESLCDESMEYVEGEEEEEVKEVVLEPKLQFSWRVMKELKEARVFVLLEPVSLFRADVKLGSVAVSQGALEKVGCPWVCREWSLCGGKCKHQEEYKSFHPGMWARFVQKQGQLRWKQRLLAEGNNPSYWDILPFEIREKILQMVAYQKHREQWAKVMEALMSFGSCCCSRRRDCEEHHPRNVLVNWRYKVRVVFSCVVV